MNKRIIFVYNAESSVFSNISDAVHKIVSPDTYECNLCKLTYGSVFMKKDWKNFIQNLPYKTEFLHKDKSLKIYPNQKQFPVVFYDNGENISVIATPEEINQAKNVSELKTLIESAVKKI